MKKSILQEKSFSFAIKIIELSDTHDVSNSSKVLINQLMRSGTSIGALIQEARNAESQRDFVHKLAIAQKECDESIYWIRLLSATKKINEETKDTLVGLAEELLKMIRSSILTSKRNQLERKAG